MCQSKFLFIFCSLFFLLTNFTYAFEETGTELLDTCLSEKQALAGNPTKSVRYGLCLGYLKGVADALNNIYFCLPQTQDTFLITQQLKQAYIHYALEHKTLLHKPAIQIIIPALQNEFLCKQ